MTRPVETPVTASSLGIAVLAMVTFEAGAAFNKGLYPALGPFGTVSARLAFGTLILWCIRRPWRGGLGATQRRLVLAYGASLGGMSLLFYLALATLPLALTLSLEMTGPLALSLAMSRRWIDIAWVAIAGAGLLLLVPGKASTGALDPTGVVFALLAGACWALYILAGRRAGADLAPGRAISLSVAVATLVTAPWGVAKAGGALLDPHNLPAAFLSGLFSTAIPYSLDLIAMSRIPPRAFGLLMSLAPVIGALAGFAMLGETLSRGQIIAILCIVGATAGSSLTDRIARARRLAD